MTMHESALVNQSEYIKSKHPKKRFIISWFHTRYFNYKKKGTWNKERWIIVKIALKYKWAISKKQSRSALLFPLIHYYLYFLVLRTFS